jgi:hypothetical protein
MAAQNTSLLSAAQFYGDRIVARATSETTPAYSTSDRTTTRSALNIADYKQRMGQNAAELIVTVRKGTLSLMLDSVRPMNEPPLS